MNASLAGAGSLIVLLLALGGEAVLGEMRWLFARVPHPRLLVGETVDFLESRLNRAMRGPRSRLVRGALVVVAVLGLAIGVGVGLAWLVDWLPYLWPLELLLMISLIAQRGPYVRTAPAVRLLAEGGLVAGQEALRPLAGLGPGALDGLGLAGTVRIAALALARAFVVQPAVLLADEPTGSLDFATGETVMALMFALNQELGTTLVLVTHDPAIAARCQRRITIEAGQISAD